MGWLNDIGKWATGVTLFDETGKLADSIGLNEALSDAGIAELGTVESIFDPLDFSGVTEGKKTKEATAAAEEAQLEALDDATSEFRRATGEAQGYLKPYAGVGQQGVDLAGFLTNPNQQFDFVKNNPMYQLGLDNLNSQTNKSAAARGRLTAGDTLQQYGTNATLAAQPLIADQKQSIIDLLNFGSGTSRAQANAAIGEGSAVGGLIQDRGNVQAATIASNNAASQQQAENNKQLAMTVGQYFFSDPKLKTNKKVIGEKNGFTLWSWDWNKLASKFGLSGSSSGVMADEVLQKMPEAIAYQDGYMKVNYSMVGI